MLPLSVCTICTKSIKRIVKERICEEAGFCRTATTSCLALCRQPVCPQTPSICWFSYRHLLLYIEAVCMRGNNRKETFTDWALTDSCHCFCLQPLFNFPTLLILIMSCHFSFPGCVLINFLPFLYLYTGNKWSQALWFWVVCLSHSHEGSISMWSWRSPAHFSFLIYKKYIKKLTQNWATRRGLHCNFKWMSQRCTAVCHGWPSRLS